MVEKSGTLMRVLAVLLTPFVGTKFLTHYWTTIGETIYYPIGAKPGLSPGVVLHEHEHVQQYLRWGFLFPLLYVFALPVGFNPFRFWWELKAYRISMLHGFNRSQVIELLSGSEYGWCMPRRVVEKLV